MRQPVAPGGAASLPRRLRGRGRACRIRAASGQPADHQGACAPGSALRAKVATDIEHAGNTSSASIPLALSRMIERGELSTDDKALLIGFGAGVCYETQVIIDYVKHAAAAT